MLKIRLQKIGKKNSPSYRIALVEHTTSPHGKFVELLGSYNPRLKQKKFKKERIEYWLTKGAQTSPTVHNLLVDEKIISEKKITAWKPKRSKAESPAAPGEGGKGEGENPKIEVAPDVPKTEVARETPKTEESAPLTLAEGEVEAPSSETVVLDVEVDSPQQKE